MLEKEKLLVINNLSFSHNVFHRYISLVRQNAAMCGYGLIDLSISLNTVGLPVMSGKFDGGWINKHQNTGPTDRQNLAIRLT